MTTTLAVEVEQSDGILKRVLIVMRIASIWQVEDAEVGGNP